VGFGHLSKRFFGSLWPGGPAPDDATWARAQLLANERDLWQQMSSADRRHSIGVARRVERALGHEASRPVLAAALLHDVGKIDARLGAYGRVVATLSVSIAGRPAAEQWSEARGFTRKIGLYVQHPQIGADRLALAGSDPLTIAWTREHHKPEEDWTLPPHLAHALKEADDD
jgi:hypothetical protein